MTKELLILFGFFAGFVIVNCVTYFILNFRLKEKIFRELAVFWLLVFAVFIVEGGIQHGKFELAAIFIINIFPIYIMARFLMRSYGLKLYSVKQYFIAALTVISMAYIESKFDLPFQVMAVPIAFVTCFPLFEGIYATFITKKNESSFVHKFMAGLVFSAGIISSLNYGFNRMVPGAEIMGFGTAFLNYVTASIVLPVFAIQELNKEKTEKLEFLVKERTAELSASKIQKEKLLRVVVHDISNALQVLVMQTNRLSTSSDETIVAASKRMMKNLDAISEITKHVKEMEYSKSRNINLMTLTIEECFTEINDLFRERFENKNVHLTLVNKVPLKTVIKVDRVTFIHSVASNIISNALKFSHPGSEVIVTAYEDRDQVHFDVLDYGVGMDDVFLKNLFEFESSFTTLGTGGERGTGFGMPLVKNYTEIFGGTVKAFSSQDNDLSGTRILVSLPAMVEINHDAILN